MVENLGVGGGKRKNCKLQTNTEVRGKCEAGRKWGWGQGLQGSVGRLGVPGRRQSEGRDKRASREVWPKDNREPSTARCVQGLPDACLRPGTAF